MSSSSSSPVPEPDAARLSNLLGAWALAVADRIAESTAAAADRGGQAPAALVALHQFAGGGTIEKLRQVLGLSHSAAVRLIDGLAADGHVVREPTADRRSVALELTRSGRAAARRILAARRQAVTATLQDLTEDERSALLPLAERLTGEMTELRLGERRRGAVPAGGWLCRLCDFEACGRPEGRCPAALNATAATAEQ